MQRLKYLLLLLAFLFPTTGFTQTIPVLSNLSQPSSGQYLRIGVRDMVAIPFTTDSSYTEFRSVELNAATLYGNGLFFVEIWDVDSFAQPRAPVQVLIGPSAPSGAATYSANASLQPSTSYFIVIGTRNGGSQTAVFVKDNNLADSSPSPVYAMGTDIDGDGAPDLVNKCQGSVGNQQAIFWECAGGLSSRFFPSFRILAEQAPPAAAQVSLSNSTLNFGNVPIGSESQQAITITNTGGTDLQLGNLGTDNGDYSFPGNVCSTAIIAPNTYCTLSVRFAPTSPGASTGTMTIPSNAASSTDTVALSGFGASAQVSLSSSALSFGDVDVGTSSSPQSLTLTNTGKAPASTCSVQVTFSPTQAGGRVGDLSIPSNAPSTPDIVTLSGVGDQAAVLLSPTSLNFGDQPVGVASAPLTVTVSDPGNAALNIGALAATGDFSLGSVDTCSNQSIVAGGSCTFDVVFTPSQTGGRSGTVSVPSDATSSPDTLAVTGTGVESILSLSTNHLAFGNQLIGTTSSEQMVTVTNAGGADLILGTLISNNPEFSVNPANTCASATLLPAASCSFGVSFGPTGNGGQSGTVTIGSNAASDPDTISVDGTGEDSFLLTANPGYVDFGDTPLNTVSPPSSIVLTNSGGADQVFGAITASARFTITQDDCSGMTLVAGSSCMVTLTFQPDHEGYTSGTLVIVTNDPLAPYGAPLLGRSGLGVPVAAATPVPVLSIWALLVGILLIASRCARCNQ